MELSTISYCYDPNGDQTAVVYGDGTPPGTPLACGTNPSYPYIVDPSSAAAAWQTTYSYDSAGELVSTTAPAAVAAPNGATTTETYDPADLLTQLNDFNGSLINITSTADGLPNSVTLGSSGDTTTTTYDNTHTPSAIALKNSTSTLPSFTYTDSPAGTILSETDTPSSPQSPATYTYDAKGRVTSMTPGTGSTLNYSVDASSNLTTLPTGASSTYDKAGELTSSVLSGITTNYTYSANGQRLTAMQGSTTIASGNWNGDGQLSAYSSSTANMTGCG